MHPILLRFLPIQPALARGLLLSPLMASHPRSLTLSSSPSCWLPLHFLSTCLCPSPCCLCPLRPRARRSFPFFPYHQCPPLSRGPRESPSACTQHESPDSLCCDRPIYSPPRKNPVYSLEFLSPLLMGSASVGCQV